MIKRTWATLIKAKILAQASVLEEIGKSPDALRHLSKKVKSGNAGNVEATAAQRYWPALFGAEFHRDRSADDVNVYLNYGYTVLRAATARAIVGAGLHPSLGLHHKSGGDALRLSDDLMEPFRPAVDLMAYELSQEDVGPLNPPLKRRLAGVLYADYLTEQGVSTLSNSLSRLAQSLAQIFLGQRKELALPHSAIPLTEDQVANLKFDDST